MPVMLGWLRRIHYTAYSSQIALHVDCSDRTMSRILPRLEEVAQANDRKVTLVGHSRGGLLSRALMTARPDLVERVVTLASPIHEPFAVTNLTLAKAADLARSRLTQACACTYGRFFRKELAPGMPPLIALFTRHDEVVRWQACLEDGARNIEIRGTHLGLLASRNVYTTVAHALTGEYDEPGITWQGKAPSLAELALAI
jgi:pimeloyl-ACP methyl ester carboxylesterase